MLDKKISVSEQVSNLPIEAQLIFTWSIPHADDLGLLPYSIKTLKALIVPMMDISLEQFENFIIQIIESGLYKVWENVIDGKGYGEYLVIAKFTNFQILKKDRKPNTLLANVSSWEQAEELGFRLEDNGGLSKEKGSRAKKREATISLGKSFDNFWQLYPRKIAKGKAWQSWLKISPDEELSNKIMAALEKHKEMEQWKKDAGQFIPHAATWLNQRRWEDEVSEEKSGRKVDKI